MAGKGRCRVAAGQVIAEPDVSRGCLVQTNDAGLGLSRRRRKPREPCLCSPASRRI